MNLLRCAGSPRRFGSFIVFLLSPLFVTPAFGQTATHDGHPVVAEEILIRLKTHDVAAQNRVRVIFPNADFEELSSSLGIQRIRVRGLNVAALLAAFANHPDVSYAEPNYVVQAVNTPNDSNYSLLWGMPAISAPAAWDITTGSTSLVIAVVDTGVDYMHSDLTANVWAAPSAFTVTASGTTIMCPVGSHGFNAILNSCDPLDDNNHGTHVSGTIGAVGNNNIGVAGVNWTARIMALKFLDSTGSGTVSNAIKAIDFAIQTKVAFAGTLTPVDVRVLSNSWGGGGFSAALLDEINSANANNALFVAAAGNTSNNNDITPFYPASYSAPNIIAVAATDVTDTLASFSSYGAASVHLGAPGVNIFSTIRNGGYASFSGTSMATPHVAGAVLLTLSACPSLSTAAVKAAILNNVDPVSNLSGRTVTGGRLNVYRAIQSCRPVGPPQSVIAFSGSGQSTTVGTAFSSALQAKVTDASSNPVANLTVTFTAPANGASASFGGGSTTTAVTNASGIATSSLPTANNITGTYNVTASVSGLNPAAFALTNTAIGAATSIFASSATPATFYPGTSPVELGVRVRSDVNGTITGIRFYKGSGDTSVHTGSLWSSVGALLATGTFSGEGAAGWQQLNFSAPVAISANTTYVASYHTGGAFYYAYNYFLNAGVDNAPLHALQNGVDGANGVYAYGSGGVFPSQSYLASNYWVDVVFAPSGSAGPPQSVVAFSGTPQSTMVGSAFGSALQAKVTDASSNPVPNVTVTFTAPTGGPTATFAGSSTAAAVTNAAGIATSPVPTANGTTGSFNVTASVIGLSPATFALTNTPAAAGLSIFSPSTTPTTFYSGTSPVELGVRFRSDVNGTITGIRFYKGSSDTSVHTGSLWSSVGALLTTGTFSGEGATGWQQLNFSAPVAISANTTYVASYHTGGAFYYAYNYFLNAGVDNAPLHALQNGVDGANGVYAYGSGGVFPSQSYLASNYWVDVVFAPSGSAGPPQSVVAFSGTPQSTTVGSAFGSALQAKVTDASSNPVPNVTVTFTAPTGGPTATFAGNSTAAAVTNAAGIATSPVPTANGTTGSFNVTASVIGLSPATFALTNTPAAAGLSIFSPSTTPTTFYSGTSPVELGVRFRSDVNGTITGIRFYKGSGDTSVHTGSLWSSVGALLATGTFSGESATGWQQLNFSAPVAISANTTYVASYHTGGAFYYAYNYFLNAGVDNAPLHALQNGVDGANGVYAYGSGGVFPSQSYLASNYWVDVVFIP